MTQKLELDQSNVAREYTDFGEFIVRFGEGVCQVVPLVVQEPRTREIH